MTKTTKNDFIDSLILPPRDENAIVQARKIVASRVEVKEPLPGQPIQVHPDKAFHLFPVGMLQHVNNLCLLTSDVTRELLTNEFQRYALLLYRTKQNPHQPLIWALRLNHGGLTDEAYISRFLTTKWAKIVNGYVVDEERDVPGYEVTRDNPFAPNIIIQPQTADIPPPWRALPDFGEIIKLAFRGKLVSSFDHQAFDHLRS